MEIIGIIAEYNPFHNGHIYHINKIKEMYPDSIIVAVVSGNFTQRGIPSIVDKWEKTKAAIKHSIDLVIELPFPFASQSSDIFAKGSISLLKELKVSKLIFGSESNDIDNLKRLAEIQESNEYEEEVKKYIDTDNYPTALNKAFEKFNVKGINDPNDLLALSYIKEINKQNANIEPISIKRTNDYHSKEISEISSATSIRNAIINNLGIMKSVPRETLDSLEEHIFLLEDYYKLLKYKILSTDNLEIYQTVTPDLTNKLKKEVLISNTWDELVLNLKSKRYTYNRINRMLIHILCNFTKELADSFKEIEYIRVLGFNNNGKEYLGKIKKEVTIPIITTFSKGNSKMLEYEQQVSNVYASILPEDQINDYIKKEYQELIKED